MAAGGSKGELASLGLTSMFPRPQTMLFLEMQGIVASLTDASLSHETVFKTDATKIESRTEGVHEVAVSTRKSE